MLILSDIREKIFVKLMQNLSVKDDTISVTKLGNFFNFLVTDFVSKVAKNIRVIFRLF